MGGSLFGYIIRSRNVIFEDTEKYYKIAEQILERYESVLGEGCTLELLQLSENLTYLVKDASGAKCAVLRISRPGYHTPEELRAELEWMERLGRDTDLSLRVPIADEEGRFIQNVYLSRSADDRLKMWTADMEQDDIDSDEEICCGVMFTYMEGTPLEDQSPEILPMWFERLGEMTAVLHTHARSWDEARNLPRFHWNYETTLGTGAIWGDWRDVPSLTPQMSAILEQADRVIHRRLMEYGMTRENYGLIHGDLRGSNILIDGERMSVIDFDDCGQGWYMQDLAASLSFIETEEYVGELIRAWLIGYQKKVRLSRRDKDMIDTFLVMRRIQLLAWAAGHENSHSVIRLREGFVEETVGLAERYVKG